MNGLIRFVLVAGAVGVVTMLAVECAGAHSCTYEIEARIVGRDSVVCRFSDGTELTAVPRPLCIENKCASGILKGMACETADECVPVDADKDGCADQFTAWCAEMPGGSN